MLPEPDSLRFASDATLAGIAGGVMLLFAAIAWWAETRRVKRKHIDAVGWVPWTRLFFIALLVGITLMLFAVKGWMGG